MGATSTNRPPPPSLGFPSTSHIVRGGADLSGAMRGRKNVSGKDAQESPYTIPSPRNQVADPNVPSELEERVAGQNYGSELGDSFMTPSQAVDAGMDDGHGANEGVFGLLNHLYQETGTGKGIGI